MAIDRFFADLAQIYNLLFVATNILVISLGLTLPQISRPIKNDCLVTLSLRTAPQNTCEIILPTNPIRWVNCCSPMRAC